MIPFLLSLALSLLAAPSSTSWLLNHGEALDIQAESMRYDAESQSLHFLGEVRLRQTGFHLDCDELHLRVKNRELLSLSARGKVRGQHGEWFFRADLLELDAKQNRLDLFGMPSLRKGETRITGESIRVDLDKGSFEVRQAKSRWRWKEDKSETSPQSQAKTSKP